MLTDCIGVSILLFRNFALKLIYLTEIYGILWQNKCVMDDFSYLNFLSGRETYLYVILNEYHKVYEVQLVG